jgi:hypothetical protein
VGQPYACLCLANNCCIASTFQAMQQRFNKLYKRRQVLRAGSALAGRRAAALGASAPLAP